MEQDWINAYIGNVSIPDDFKLSINTELNGNLTCWLAWQWRLLMTMYTEQGRHVFMWSVGAKGLSPSAPGNVNETFFWHQSRVYLHLPEIEQLADFQVVIKAQRRSSFCRVWVEAVIIAETLLRLSEYSQKVIKVVPSSTFIGTGIPGNWSTYQTGLFPLCKRMIEQTKLCIIFMFIVLGEARIQKWVEKSQQTRPKKYVRRRKKKSLSPQGWINIRYFLLVTNMEE